MTAAEDRARAALAEYARHKQGIPGTRCSVGDVVAAATEALLAERQEPALPDLSDVDRGRIDLDTPGVRWGLGGEK